jgi:nicotinate-nucleotide pyrophosphorylase
MHIQTDVERALREDIGDGDLTAELVPASAIIGATIVTRHDMTMAGRPWVDQVFRQLDPHITLCPSSSKWNRRSDYLMESFAHLGCVVRYLLIVQLFLLVLCGSKLFAPPVE